MHLGNSIICPVTGIPMILAMGGMAFYSFKKAKTDFSKEKVLPLIALSALVFGLQMINFTIPFTSSSGHIVGALLLAALLGPYVAFLSICAILLVQALFFADGGLIAYGCNVFNMGFLACFVAYPFIYKPLKEKNKGFLGMILASITALELGCIAISLESLISGSITKAMSFTLLLESIHFVIATIEGIISAFIVFAFQKTNFSKISSYFTIGISLILAGVISNYASTKPDGLEWSLIKISDAFVEQTQGKIYLFCQNLQEKTSVFANINSEFANISGLLIVALTVMFLGYMILKNKKEAEV